MSEPSRDTPQYEMGQAETERLRRVETTFLARPRVSIRLRIVAGFLLCFFLLAVTGLINLVILYQARSKLHFLDVSQSLSLEIQRASHTAKLDFPNEKNLATAAASAKDAFDLFMKEGAQIMGATGEKDLALLNYQMGHFVQLLDDGLALARNSAASEHEEATLKEQMDTSASNLLNLLRTMKAREAAAADHVLSLSQKLPFVFSALMLVIIFWITSLLAGTITDSLKRLEESTRRIAGGDFSLMNPKRRYHDEFSDLSVAVNRMLSELRAREAQVVKADRLASVGLVTSGFARQFSETLDAITDHVGSFLDQCPEAKVCEQCGLLQALSAETDRGKETVATLLEFTLDHDFVLSDVSLHEVVESARHLLQDQMDEAQVSFSNGIPPDMPKIRGAANQLRHVFVNLFHNAVQAMPEGGELSVKASLLEGERASVTVSDTGIGIPPEDLTHLFDPSFTTKDTEGGTGLGLSISYGLIKRHGGEIRAESLLGSGTTISLTLPLAKPDS